jgi:hypothetical protein
MLSGAFFQDPQHGIYGIIRVQQIHADGNNRQGIEAVKMLAQVDGIFFGGDEAIGLAALLQVEKVMDIFFCVAVMIAKSGFRRGLNSGGTQLRQKSQGARDSAECDGVGGNMLWRDAAAHAPDELAGERKGMGNSIAG